jgi:RNA polymerase sigma-70 factor (ECF subfamily)
VEPAARDFIPGFAVVTGREVESTEESGIRMSRTETSGDGNGGAPEAFEALAVPLLSPLYNFARWLTRDDSEAEDLVQETFARALRGFPTFQEGTNFKAWIFRILKNAFLSSRSGTAHLLAMAAVPLEDEPEGERLREGSRDGEAASTRETPETILLAAVDRRLVQAAIAALPPATREIVLLRDVEGLSYREIGDVVGIPVGTVMSRLSRGREAIRLSVRGKG